MVRMQGLPGGVTPCMANTGMCHWSAHCQSTELDTRHKRAIIKRHLISTNRSIHLYIIWIRTPGKFKLSFRSYNRLTQHRPCLTRNLKRINSCFHILKNLIRRGLEKFKMLTANKRKRHQWQIVEPQQKHKHKIQLCMYLFFYFYKIHLGSYSEPAGHFVHYSLMIWSHKGTKEVLIGKIERIINHPLLLELSYLRIKPKTQSQQGKKWCPIQGSRSSKTILYQAMHTYLPYISDYPTLLSPRRIKFNGVNERRYVVNYI